MRTEGRVPVFQVREIPIIVVGNCQENLVIVLRHKETSIKAG